MEKHRCCSLKTYISIFFPLLVHLLILLCSKKWETINYITYLSGFSVIKKEGVEAPAQIGRIYFPSRVSNLENSFSVVSISFPDSGLCVFSVYPNSYIEIKKAYKEPNGKIYVEVSDIYGIVLGRSKECIIQYGHLKARNALLRLMREAPSASRIEVIEGEAKVAKDKIYAGSGVLIEGRIEQYPLNRGVDLVLPIPGRFPKPLVFMWRKVETHAKYYLEISDDKNFDTVKFIQETNSNTFFPEQITLKLTSDVYFWRIWYKDRTGRGSFFSTPVSFTVSTQRLVR